MVGRGGSGVDHADRGVRDDGIGHGGHAVAARHVGADETLEADDDVRQVRRRVHRPATAAVRAPSRVDLAETVGEITPTLRYAARGVDDVATQGVVVGLGIIKSQVPKILLFKYKVSKIGRLIAS